MKRVLKALGKGAKRIGPAIVAVYRRYPARCTSYVVSGVVVAGGALGIVIDQASAKTIIELVLPILLTGETIHHRVSPAR
jgi:hypothetical protein